MGRGDWYRRTSWTEQDREEFDARLGRSRGAENKAQYIQIQAQTLLETENVEWIEAALDLVTGSFAQFPDVLYRARNYDTAGACCARLGRHEEAIGYYRRALAREKEFPGIRTNACFHFGQLVAESERQDLFDEALRALDDYRTPIFPTHIYLERGIRSLIAAARGDRSGARQLAAEALDAASVRDSGLGHGRDNIGIVQNTDTAFYRKLRHLGEDVANIERDG